MYARKVTFRLKANMHLEYAHAFENQIVPLLNKQKGFKGEITMRNPSAVEGFSISLWESKADADEYNSKVYPGVVKILAKLLDGTPRVYAFETVNSTFHNVPAYV